MRLDSNLSSSLFLNYANHILTLLSPNCHSVCRRSISHNLTICRNPVQQGTGLSSRARLKLFKAVYIWRWWQPYNKYQCRYVHQGPNTFPLAIYFNLWAQICSDHRQRHKWYIPTDKKDFRKWPVRRPQSVVAYDPRINPIWRSDWQLEWPILHPSTMSS